MADKENININEENITEENIPEEAETKEAEETASEIDERDSELAALKDKILRISAEYDNFRKRTEKEKSALYSLAKADTVSAFLPLSDNIEKAVINMPEATEGEWKAVAEGIALIKKQLEEILKKLGVTEIEALGKEFDPELHNAVMHTEDEEAGENTVVEEFQKGFKIEDRVIRHSVVKVAN